MARFTASLILIIAINTGNAEGDKDRALLEKQKGELYSQIQEAINESVIYLNKTNDAEAKMGINYLQQLQQNLAEINQTDSKIEVERRSIKATSKKRDKYKHRIRFTLEEIQSLLSKHAKKEGIIDHGKVVSPQFIEMQKKVNEWLLQKKLEKDKIKEFKEKRKREFLAGGREKCPRHGQGKKTVKSGGTKRKAMYPCCRKCCKKSYMGCL